MKRRFLGIISALITVCMLGGCAEKKEQMSVIYVSSGEANNNSSPPVSIGQTASAAESGNGISSANVPPSIVIPGGSSASSSSSSPAVSSSSSSASVPAVSDPNETPGGEPNDDPVISSSSDSSSSDSSSSSSGDPNTSDVPADPGSVVPDIPIGSNNYSAVNYSEVKGVWISYIELAALSSGSSSNFRNSIGAIYDNCLSLGINTVYVHVRSHGDAYYKSDFYPRTKYIGGSYDPLPIMIDEAHKRGLSFQAWINPLRGCSVSNIGSESGFPLSHWAGGNTRLVEYNGYYWLNPAYDDVIELISKGAGEIVANYDVDGVHIDDYFYPTTEEWFDSTAFSESSYNSLSDFRLANCDRLVSSLYGAVKSANSTAIFGVSPQGNMANNYAYMYADVEKWCTQSGYLDYIMPQLYFGFKNALQPYSEVLTQWNTLAAAGHVKLIVGLSPAKIGTEDNFGGNEGKYEWINDKEILKRQFTEASSKSAYGGICLYSYNSIFAPSSDVKSQVDEEISDLKTVLM